jgi:hypothetical protein
MPPFGWGRSTGGLALQGRPKPGGFLVFAAKKEVTGRAQMKENSMTQLQTRSKRRQDLGDGKTSAAEIKKF